MPSSNCRAVVRARISCCCWKSSETISWARFNDRIPRMKATASSSTTTSPRPVSSLLIPIFTIINYSNSVVSGTNIALAARARAPLTSHFEYLSNYEGGPCPPYMSGHGVLGFPRTPIFIKKSLVAQASSLCWRRLKPAATFCQFTLLTPIAKSLPDTTYSNSNPGVIVLREKLLVVLLHRLFRQHDHVQLLAQHHQPAQELQPLFQGRGVKTVDAGGAGVLLELHPEVQLPEDLGQEPPPAHPAGQLRPAAVEGETHIALARHPQVRLDGGEVEPQA